MKEKTESHCEGIGRHSGVAMSTSVPDVDAWFVREVLPMEAALIQFLHRNWRDQSDYADLCQEVYVRIYEAAQIQIPHPVKPLMFRIARNLMIDRIRRAQIVPIDAVADVEALSLAMDEPGPERVLMARDGLRRVQAALDRLPSRARDVIVMKQIDGLTRREIATVPHLGGFIGASYRVGAFKASLGYRGDWFFGAFDTGLATSQKADRGFVGPFINIAIDIGN